MIESPYNSDSDDRYDMLLRWLQNCGIEHKEVTPASADASFRRYFRVFTADKSLIAVDSPPEHNNNPQFIDIACRLSNAQINTPELIYYSLEKGFLLLQDFGKEVLQQTLADSDVIHSQQLYAEAMQCINTMQSAAATDGLPHYNAELLNKEMQLFTDWYLKEHLHHEPSSSDLQTIDSTFKLCIDNALQQPQAFVHRDYHCRNLMPLTIHSNSSHAMGERTSTQQEKTTPELGVIDFQDAILGPVTYDPVSLLKDAYIDWPEGFVEKFSDQHRLSLNPIPEKAQYVRWFDLMGLQRHIKILGIFCRLNYRDSKSQYLDNLPLVLLHIDRTTNKYPELEGFRQLVKETAA